MIECATYRPLGHFEGDPGTGYRSKEEIAEWKLRDPIDRLAGTAVQAGLVAEAELRDIEQQVERVIDEAYEFARLSPEADAATVSDFVYA